MLLTITLTAWLLSYLNFYYAGQRSVLWLRWGAIQVNWEYTVSDPQPNVINLGRWPPVPQQVLHDLSLKERKWVVAEPRGMCGYIDSRTYWLPRWGQYLIVGLKGWVVHHVFLPLWIPMAVFGILPLCHAISSYRRWRQSRSGLCPQCSYDLRASSTRCPECGRPITPATPPHQPTAP